MATLNCSLFRVGHHNILFHVFRNSLPILAIISAAAMANGPTTAPADISASEMPSTLVTLHVKDVSCGVAMTKILEAAHVAIPKLTEGLLASYEKQKITLDLDRQPYWEAMIQICRRMELSADSNQPEMILYPNRPEWAERPHLLAGPFLLQADSAIFVFHGKLGRQPSFDTKYCYLGFSLLAESITPAIRVDRFEVKEITDNTGAEIKLTKIPKGSNTMFADFRNGRCAVGVSLDPSPGARSIAHIKGEIDVVVETASATMEFDGIRATTESTARVGPLDCKFTAHLAQNSFDAEIEFNDPRNDPALWDTVRKNLRTTQPVVVDAQGKPMSYAGNGWQRRPAFSEQTVQRFQWQSSKGLKDPPQQPLRLTWRIPVASRIVRLPFEFSNLALPDGD